MSGSQPALATADFQILLALADGPKHGRGIKLDVRTRTDGEVVMGPGTLYGAIRRLLERSWIDEVDAPEGEPADDERRRYYRITAEGEAAARAEVARLRTLIGIARAKDLVGGVTG